MRLKRWVTALEKWASSFLMLDEVDLAAEVEDSGGQYGSLWGASSSRKPDTSKSSKSGNSDRGKLDRTLPGLVGRTWGKVLIVGVDEPEGALVKYCALSGS